RPLRAIHTPLFYQECCDRYLNPPIYEGSHFENGHFFDGDGYARVKFSGSSLARGRCRFMDDDAQEWRTTDYHRITRDVLDRTIGKSRLRRADYAEFAKRWYSANPPQLPAAPRPRTQVSPRHVAVLRMWHNGGVRRA
ncbi:hypothetical protein, partial [Rhodococcus olei]|uniref:hypothetical protein n=1 Tax=Rhodococcus olei TaxID=2161675 RepID=UPI0031EDBA90